MRHVRWTSFLIVCAALALAGCQTPGRTAATSAPAIAQPYGDGAQAAAASAAGGQSASQDPRATDTARIAPVTTVGSGQGATTSSTQSTEGRVVASGAGVTQGLQVPTDALARTGGGAIPQVIQQYRTDIAALWKQAEALLADARCARAVGQVDQANLIMTDYRAALETIREMQGALAVAESGCAANITNNYFQQGQRVVQSVVSGTDAGSPSVPISEAGARAAAEALSTGAAAVMTAEPSPVETTSAGTLPPSVPAFPPPAAPATPEALPDAPPSGTLGDPLPPLPPVGG